MSVNGIILYTQPNCSFCDDMKSMLDQTGYTYYTINIKENAEALEFMKTQGHRVVPQLYANKQHINKKENTQDYTPEELSRLITEAMDSWPWQDSGIEQGI
jgi:glutaredoxin